MELRDSVEDVIRKSQDRQSERLALWRSIVETYQSGNPKQLTAAVDRMAEPHLDRMRSTLETLRSKLRGDHV